MLFMIRIMSVIVYATCLGWSGSAHALFFAGGNGDGFGVSELMYSRTWGYIGGEGRGDIMLSTGSQTQMTFTSAADQTFYLGDDPTGASVLTITQDAAIGAGVVFGNDLRVTIPASLGMIWDPAVTTVTLGGSAPDKVASGVTYTDGGRTLVLDVTLDFVDGDSITVSGLAFSSFVSVGMDDLQLDITNGAGAKDIDPFYKLLLVTERSNGFIGGDRRGE